MQIFVNNTRPRLTTLCVIMPPAKEGLSPDRVNIQLEPGINPVIKAQWDKALEVVTVQAMIEEGALKEMGPTPNGTLRELSEEQAFPIIKETFSLKLLNQWLAEEKRPKVVASLKRRLEEHAAATKVEEKKQ